MARFFLVFAAIVLSSVMFYAEGTLREGEPSRFLGIPTVGTHGTTSSESSSDSTSDDLAAEAPPIDGWLVFGGTGVLVLGAGAGVVEIGLYGVGLLFATGQLCAGLMILGQVGLGLVFFVAQGGVGAAGLGQLAIGGLVKGQIELGPSGGAFMRQMNDDVGGLLRFWGTPRAE